MGGARRSEEEKRGGGGGRRSGGDLGGLDVALHYARQDLLPLAPLRTARCLDRTVASLAAARVVRALRTFPRSGISGRWPRLAPP